MHCVRDAQRSMTRSLALEVPTIKVKRQHVTFLPFLTGGVYFYTNGTDLLSTLTECFLNPLPMEHQTEVFKRYKKVMWLGFFFFPTQETKLTGRIFSVKFFLSFFF